MHLRLNDVLQWTGSVCLLTMYVIMSFLPNLHPWNIVAGVAGGSCFLTWCMRVGNRPQLIVNAVAIMIGIMGLVRAWI